MNTRQSRATRLRYPIPRTSSLLKIAFIGCLLLVFAFPVLAAPAQYPYRITATVGMVADIAQRVAGNRATVKSIMGAGVDPHLYKPTRDDVAAMMSSEVVLYSGLLLEGKMTSVLEKLGKRKAVRAVSEAIDKSLLMDSEVPGHPDPHVWMDPSLWAEAVRGVAKVLSEYDPANASEYRSNAKSYASQCLQLHEYGIKVLSSIPERKRVLISSHDAFGYFGRAFRLKVLGVQGISTDSEAGLRRINQLADLIVENDVRAVFVESSVPRKNIQALVQGVQARDRKLLIGGELFSDAMGPAGTYEGTYLGMVDHNITRVAAALGGKAPDRGWQGKLQPASAHQTTEAGKARSEKVGS